MTRYRALAPRAFIAILAVTALFLLLIPTAPAAVDRAVGSDPRVTDGQKTLTHANLTNPIPATDRLSGLRGHTITVRVESTNNELLPCDDPATPPEAQRARMHYVISANGANATPTSPSKPLTCPSDTAPLATFHNYVATIPESELRAAPVNAQVSFLFVIRSSGTAGEQTHRIPRADETPSTYKYFLDTSRPIITHRVPDFEPGASQDVAVTNVARTNLNFTVADNALEAPLDASTLNITVPASTPPLFTQHFDCVGQSAHRISCALNLQVLGPQFRFAEGNYTMNVRVNDTTRNTIQGNPAQLKFRIDLGAPNVTDVTAVPNSVATAAPPGGLAMTGRGTNITVSATIRDISMNTNTTRDVVAQLYNATRALESNLVPMKFVGNNRWEAKDVRVPDAWPEGIYAVSARVIADDMGGNSRTNTTGAVVDGRFVSRDAFLVDASRPAINESRVPEFIREAPHEVRANITDEGSGLDKTKVKIRFYALVGEFQQNVTGTTRVGPYHEATMANPSGDTFTYTIPAARHGSIITYFIMATDKANVTSFTDTHLLRVDGQGPTIREIDPRPFRGPPFNTFRIEATDPISGVNASTVKLYYNFGGSTFRTVTMEREQNTTFFRGSANFTGATHGGTLSYYFDAQDNVGNLGNLSSAQQPRTATVDLRPPTSTLSSPAVFNGERFKVEWNGTDVGAGVESFTLQARVRGDTQWINVLQDTRARSMDFCGEGNRTYELRVFAKDAAGNVESPADAPMSTTEVQGPGCKEIITVRVLTPTIGQRVDGRQNSTTIQYTALTSASATPTHSLRIAILFSPDDGVHYYTFASSLNNTGTYQLRLSDLPSCRVCLVKVQALSLSGVKGEGTSVPFEIVNGNPQVDLDGNGLSDSWELRYGRTLSQFRPGDDNDRDGLNNLQESQFGTDPTSRDSDGDGASDRAEVRAGTSPLSAQSTPGRVAIREDQYTHWYWVVPGLFLGTCILFFAGLARRW